MITKEQLPEKYHVTFDSVMGSPDIPDAVKQMILAKLLAEG